MSDHHDPMEPGDEQETTAQRRDADLARLLAGDPVPDHGDGFWDDLSTALRAEGNGAGIDTSVVVAGQAVAESAARFDSSDATPAPIVDLDRHRQRRGRLGPALLAAAAAVVVAAGIFGAASIDRDRVEVATDVGDGQRADGADDGSGATNGADDDVDDDAIDGAEDEVGSSASEAVGGFDYSAPPETATRFDGRAVGFTPDGTSLLVLTEVLGGELGCEASELLTLSARDLTTGVERPLLPAGRTVETGGLEIRMLEALDGGARRIGVTEYCDGFRSSTWTAAMAPDGTVSNIIEVPVDETARGSERWPVFVDDPFEPPELELDPQAGFRLIALSPDGQLGLFTRGEVVVVEELDGDRVWTFPTPLSDDEFPTGAFDPTGSVVVVDTRSEPLMVWDFRAGTVAPIGGSIDPGFLDVVDNVVRVAFSADGSRLLVAGVETSGDFATWVLGYRPDAVEPSSAAGSAEDPATEDAPTEDAPAEVAGCSGSTGFEAGPVIDDLPTAVAERVQQIDQAAAACDWSSFETLTAGDFTASFGGGSAVDEWRAPDGTDTGVMARMRLVFRQPYGEVEVDGAITYVWPAVFTRDGCEAYTDEDRASLADLGLTEADIGNDCEALGGYGGHRAGIAEDGDWRYFVAGD